jgi:putative ABC transport system permease protein
MPDNGHFHFDIMLSMDNVNYQFGNFLSANFTTYIALQKGTDPAIFNKIFPEVINKYVMPQAQAIMQIKSMEEFKKSGNSLEYRLMPLTKIHLFSDRFPELEPNGDIQNIYIFSAVALFILLIACINFINLSTARSANRAREVGIRKVLGTGRKTLIWQFLTESTLVAFIGMIIALGITVLILPFFNEVASKKLYFSSLFNPGFIVLLLSIPLIVGLVAGSYPALYMSAFQPITVLKGKLSTGFKKSRLRSSLVVFQFATTIILIIATIVVYSQLNFIQNRKLGFNKEQVFIVDNSVALGQQAETFKTEILKLPGVLSGSLSSYLPVSNSSRSNNSFSKEAIMDVKNALNLQTWQIDDTYLQTLGMELLKGRNFSKEFGTDSNAVIINESCARLLGYEDPMGKYIYTGIDRNGTKVNRLTIIGIVKDFHYESLRHEVGPLVMLYDRSIGAGIFKVNTKDLKPLVAGVESVWKKMAPEIPFSYRFLDESFDSMYRAEQRTGKIALAFAILAIVVASLGLFGLAAFASEQRVKEIGIRKILGASIGNITGMLSKDFLKLILIASLIAFPVAGWIMYKWLQNFAYRVEIHWWVFLVAAILAILIAIITISFQAIKAAVANPVKSLRTE